MDNNLHFAIELYEYEKLALESKILNCLEDFDGPDYQLAHYHQKALYQVHCTLRRLKSYNDPLFEEKERIKSKIITIQKQLDKNESIFARERLAKRLEDAKCHLEKVNSIPPIDQQPVSETVLDKAVVELLAKKMKRFRLVFDGEENLFLEFTRSKQKVNISLPNIRQHLKHRIFSESELQHLSNHGFVSTNRNKLQAVIIVKDERTAYQYIRFLLIKLIFGTLGYGNKGSSYIQFLP